MAAIENELCPLCLRQQLKAAEAAGEAAVSQLKAELELARTWATAYNGIEKHADELWRELGREDGWEYPLEVAEVWRDKFKAAEQQFADQSSAIAQIQKRYREAVSVHLENAGRQQREGFWGQANDSRTRAELCKAFADQLDALRRLGEGTNQQPAPEST